MSNLEAIQREARYKYSSAYPLELRNSGLGLRLTCSATSNRGLLPGTPSLDGISVIVYNPNAFDVDIATGDGTVTATDAHYPIRARDKEVISLDPDDTHIAVITTGGTGVIRVHRGPGN